MSEPERAIVYDHDRAILVELPRTLTVQHEGRTRELFLRVARGVIRDVPQQKREHEPYLHVGPWTENPQP